MPLSPIPMNVWIFRDGIDNAIYEGYLPAVPHIGHAITVEGHPLLRVYDVAWQLDDVPFAVAVHTAVTP